ncbi:LemA family protein [Streptomyces sp. NPDC057011]|uniref:LemA family protein n=1 Tax=unclassified Streptomyces TaxID=2593676 RepID=UPI00363EF945
MTPLGITVAAGCAALVLLVPLWLITTRNRLVRRRGRVDDAWARLDVQLRLRYDLVPSLVRAARAHAAHERDTLEVAERAHEAALGASGPADRARAEVALRRGVRGLLALSAAYPQLRADTGFAGLLRQLEATEDRTAYARQSYNDAVSAFNTAVGRFPARFAAGRPGFRACEPFLTAEGGSGPSMVRF